MEQLIKDYGYVVIFIVTLLEGETILLLGGFAAHQGYLNLQLAILTAFIGSTFGDQFFFHLAKWKGSYLVKKSVMLSRNFPKARKLVDRYGSLIVLVARYMYGIRTPLVMMCGLADMGALRFTILNIIAAAIWAISFGLIGYLFGKTAEIIVGDIGRYENIVVGCVVLLATTLWVFRHMRKRRKGSQRSSP
jgi:membrane protein DedA with SNARE-associated domain